jgi:hypothetical protein
MSALSRFPKEALPPKKIYLQWDGDAKEGSELPLEKRGEICWCGDKIFGRDVAYIRADVVKSKIERAKTSIFKAIKGDE